MIFVDDDMMTPGDFVAAHLNEHRHRRDLVLLGQRDRVPYRIWSNAGCDAEEFLLTHTVPDPRSSSFSGDEWLRAPWALMAGCNFSARCEHILAAGMFDEEHVGWGFEDVDLAYRLFGLGLKFDVLRNSIPIHLDDPVWPHGQQAQRLTQEKTEGYLRNGQRFATKFIDDKIVQWLVYRDRFHRLLPCTGNGVAPDIYPEVLDFLGAQKPDEIPTEFSLLSPYEEADARFLETMVPRDSLD
jgi:hypothetical protein